MKAEKFDYHLTPKQPFNLIHGKRPPYNGYFKPVPDIHYALHFGVLLKGRFNLGISGFETLIEPGDVWFCGSWEAHVANRFMNVPFEYLLMTILPEKLGATGCHSELNWMLPFVIEPSKRPHISDDCSRTKMIKSAKDISSIYEKQPLGWRSLCWFKIHELILNVLSANGYYDKPNVEEQTSAYKRIVPAIELLKEKNGRQISINEAAEVCFLGKSRFCALFKAAIGSSFAKYAARTRISMAAAEIKKNNALIKEIAEAWGYYDESHFYRVFRKFFHCSPSDFREKNIKEYEKNQLY